MATLEEIHAQLMGMKETNEKVHAFLSETVQEVREDVKAFKEICHDRQAMCKAANSARMSELGERIAKINGRTSTHDAPVLTRKGDWVRENWKVLGIMLFLASAAGSNITLIIKKVLGL